MTKKKSVSWAQIIIVLAVIVIPIIFIYFRWRLVSVSGNTPKGIGFFQVLTDSKMVYSYFSLKDINGKYTSANGKAHIIMYQDISDISDENTSIVWDQTFDVKKKNFIRAKIGGGVTKKYAIICPLFKINRNKISSVNKNIRCKLEFSSGGSRWEKEIKAVI